MKPPIKPPSQRTHSIALRALSRRGTRPTAAQIPVPTSLLGEKRWAVIADHYFANNLTYDGARAEAMEMRRKKQPGVVVVTNEAAQRMLSGVEIASAPASSDLKFG